MLLTGEWFDVLQRVQDTNVDIARSEVPTAVFFVSSGDEMLCCWVNVPDILKGLGHYVSFNLRKHQH
jgi:hypothetical protein